MSITKYALLLGAKNGWFVNFKADDNSISGEVPTVTFDIEKAKVYSTKRGAMDAATQLYDEQPHLVTLEVKIAPVAMGEVITKSQMIAAREEREKNKRERLLKKMEKDSKIALAAWNKEQGIG